MTAYPNDTVAACKVRTCMGCDRCAEVCPIRAEDPSFSPSRLVSDVAGGIALDPEDSTLWGCTLCRACTARCPEPEVDFPGFVLAQRAAARAGALGEARPAHHGVLHLLASPPFTPERTPERCGWVREARPAPDRSTLFFTGCLPFLDGLFADDLGYRPIRAAQGALALLDAAGLAPTVLPDEPCCGAELLLVGDREGGRRQARRVAAFLEAHGIARLIALCPQCAWVLREIYPREGMALGAEIKTAAEVLSGRAASMAVEGASGDGAGTTEGSDAGTGRAAGTRTVALYHWPALGNGAGGAEEALLARVPGLAVRPVDPKPSAGLGGFHHCGRTARRVQAASLARTARAGASLLVSAVPKDTVHFRCAVRPSAWKSGLIETADLFAFLGDLKIQFENKERSA